MLATEVACVASIQQGRCCNRPVPRHTGDSRHWLIADAYSGIFHNPEMTFWGRCGQRTIQTGAHFHEPVSGLIGEAKNYDAGILFRRIRPDVGEVGILR